MTVIAHHTMLALAIGDLPPLTSLPVTMQIDLLGNDEFRLVSVTPLSLPDQAILPDGTLRLADGQRLHSTLAEAICAAARCHIAAHIAVIARRARKLEVVK